MSEALPDIEFLVPHASDMSLLDRVLAADDASLLAEVTPRAGQLFCRDGEIGSWVGIEYMAQAIAAWAGLRARQRGEAPKVGFLLGSRRYQTEVPAFALNAPLRVRIELQFLADNGLGQFECRIDSAERCLATAQLKVFEPSDTGQFIEESMQ
ncbi:ApeP family dehydratase [Chromobacterium alticapitis]|uniref:3-hydroxylacyl-ACP dehydratase n=1 Tax=Chromobacterium alticapitis TaxID=2073169 RepID=A0A2S5DDQ7_9NEIS|nr:hotdog family protein [Chromobacterium alticapitis]POZ61118.1 3-hydroxylacyl-ACP dehydratase [Chromobacterium alticapitis]